MAPPANSSRSRTHTIPDDRSLFLFGPLHRRKSASSLPASAAANRRGAPPASASGSVPTLPTPPPLPPLSPAPVTAPATPAVEAATATAFGPWSGTFLDAGPDADADTEDDDFYDASESAGVTATAADANAKPASTSALGAIRPQAKHNASRSRQPQPQPPPPSNARDSFISILDDPFFQRYHTAGDWFSDDGPVPGPATPSLPPDPIPSPATTADPDLLAGDLKSRHDKASPAAWPLPRRESLTVTDHGLWPPPKKMEAANIAVIGADGVGKSAFIQRALRLPKPPTQDINAIRLDVEGRPFVVALVELDLEQFNVDPSRKIHWPPSINGHIVPHIDGALMLYDVMNKDSIRELPPILAALSNAGLPTILVATKCDNPEPTRQLNADALATVFPSILADFKTSVNAPGNTHECLQTIVLAAVYNRKGAERPDSNYAYTRRRAASSAGHLDTPPDSVNGRPLSSEQGSSKHSRASSDLSLLRGGPSSAADREGYYRAQNSRSPRIDYPNTPQLASSSFGAEITDENASQSVHGMLRSSGTRLDAGVDSSFLDIEESDAESLRYQDDVPIPQRNDEILSDTPAKLAGTPLDDLVDRLLIAPMTRTDCNFQDIFLCLYRKFAAPHVLLAAIVSRLNKTWDDRSTHFLERTATQFRFIEVIARWVSLYPGDFARPSSREQLEALARRLADEPIFALAAQQLQDHLDNDVAEDDDTAWAICDEPPEGDAAAATGSGPGGPECDALPSDSLRSLTLEGSRSSGRPPSDTGSGGNGAGRDSHSHFQPQFNSYEDYEREAATLVPMATLPLNKVRYHTFMGLDPNEVADEITRIDWIMFSSIRIRDLVRHVSLSNQEKERCRSLKNMNRMIAHFNHVARWVANMILIRDKAKHRAPCLQKFMVIALRLRQLKNYNGLAAVLAGINGSAIHRLAQTRALVDADIQKRFARLVVLMSSQKSHTTYRLAWKNSRLPRIPFMPLHRRDLVSAEEGGRTFVGPQGDRINWKKFEVLGEVLLPIMKSQGTPYPDLTRHAESREMIMDCRMTMDEEEIYQRSVQVEPAGGTTDIRKKFPWLPK